jgi:hypothetical protein
MVNVDNDDWPLVNCMLIVEHYYNYNKLIVNTE